MGLGLVLSPYAPLCTYWLKEVNNMHIFWLSWTIQQWFIFCSTAFVLGGVVGLAHNYIEDRRQR